LWRGRDMLDPMPPKNFVGSIHVVHDDGNVLEPVIVALGVA
jgi:hypothetical protein